MGTHLFTFMGTGAGCGVPAFFCECPACEEARRVPRARRGDCGVMVRRLPGDSAQDCQSPACTNDIEQGEATVESTERGLTVLIDTPPDTRHQLNREGIRAVDRVLFTHAHSDHIGGLLELEYMIALRTKQPLPIYGSPGALEGIATEFHFMDYCLQPNELMPGQTLELDGVRYTALPVHHAPGTYGYLIETDDTRLFYASDTGPLPPATAERLKGVDVLALDATYWKHCPTDQHHSIQQTIEEGFALGAGKIYLTHLCMHYSEPITLVELEDYLAQYNGLVQAAADGLTFEI